MKFGKSQIAKETFYAAKNPIKIWDVNVDNIVISKLIKTKTNSEYLIGYLDKDKRPLVLIMPKMGGYVKTLKAEVKTKKLMSFCIDDKKLLWKYKTTWTDIEELKNIKLNTLPVYDDRYIKVEIRTYSDKVYTNLKYARRWYRMWIFHSHFYLFFTFIWKQILPTSICRQLYL